MHNVFCASYKANMKQTVVAKSETPRRDTAVNSLLIGVGKEAYHLAELNERSTGRIIRLRGYKYLTADISASTGLPFQIHPGEKFTRPLYQEWRSFLELCDHGNLYGIILKYTAWGYHLPEAFIWWTFLQLMMACDTMGSAPDKPFSYENFAKFGDAWENSYMLHHDMKEENIFVKTQPENKVTPLPYNTYPLVELADFGLSQVTAANDPFNEAKLMKSGTPMYFAPVSQLLIQSDIF